MATRAVLSVLLLLAMGGAAWAQAAWAPGWMSVAFLALLVSYFMIGLAFMYAIGFQDARMEAWCRHEFYQNSATAVLLGMLVGVSALLDNTLYPAFWSTSILNPESQRASASVCPSSTLSVPGFGLSVTLNSLRYSPPRGGRGFGNIQNHVVGYVGCLRTAVTKYLLELNLGGVFFGFISSLMFSFEFVEIKFGMLNIMPGVVMKPVTDMLGYINTLVAMLFLQLRVQELVLTFARDYAFSFLLPLGVALRAFTFTRGAGGALIAIAVGFYIVLPITYLFQEEITADYCARHDCQRSLLARFGYAGNLYDIIVGLMASAQSGGIGRGLTVAGSFGQGYSLSELMSLNGPFGPVIFVAGISGAVLPALGLITTFIFMKSFANLMGSDVDFSTLIKIV